MLNDILKYRIIKQIANTFTFSKRVSVSKINTINLIQIDNWRTCLMNEELIELSSFSSTIKILSWPKKRSDFEMKLSLLELTLCFCKMFDLPEWSRVWLASNLCLVTITIPKSLAISSISSSFHRLGMLNESNISAPQSSFKWILSAEFRFNSARWWRRTSTVLTQWSWLLSHSLSRIQCWLPCSGLNDSLTISHRCLAGAMNFPAVLL